MGIDREYPTIPSMAEWKAAFDALEKLGFKRTYTCMVNNVIQYDPEAFGCQYMRDGEVFWLNYKTAFTVIESAAALVLK